LILLLTIVIYYLFSEIVQNLSDWNSTVDPRRSFRY